MKIQGINSKREISKITIQLLACFMLFFVVQVNYAQHNSIDYNDVKDVENYGRFRYVEIRGHTGIHLYGGETLNEDVTDGYGSIEVRYGWQPSKKDHWSAPYGWMSYGVGWYSGFIGDPQVFGKPNALYGFANFPMSKPNKKNMFELNPAFGLTYNLNPYNSETNPNNDAIGSRMAVYFNLYFGAALRLSRSIDMTYGIDFTHFSNGRSSVPNWGLNMFGVSLGFRHYYNADQHKVNNDPFTDELLQARFNRPNARKLRKNTDKPNSLNLHFAIGTVQNYSEQGLDRRHSVWSGIVDYRHKFNEMHGIAVGFDIFHDNSLQVLYPDDKEALYLYGLHGGYDFMFWRFTIHAQIGAYLSDDRGKDAMYARPALQYDINDWLHAQVGLKTRRGFAADWVEFGIGVTPFKW